jgi:4'-phosphopantetheinyl transferase
LSVKIGTKSVDATKRATIATAMTQPTDLARDRLADLDGALPADEVHVWHIDLAISDNQIATLFELLSPAERDRAARFKVVSPRNQFVIARGFLRLALGRYLHTEPKQIEFRLQPHGKPELLGNSSWQFNVSHCEGAALIAITRGRRVGVDVERIRYDIEVMELAQRFFSHPEVEWLRSVPESERVPSFYACWTAKEAYIKACGEGLSKPLQDFGIIPFSGVSKLELNAYNDPTEVKRWSMLQLELAPELRSAIAVEGIAGIRIGRWRP